MYVREAPFCMCVSKGFCDAVKCCPPARRFGLAFPGPLSDRHVRGWAVPTPRNPWPAPHVNLAFWTRAPRTTPSMLRLVNVLSVVCCCVGVPVADVGMYVCGPACCACCGVLQRRHNFDTFLKRLRSRHACELTLNWLGTATRNSLSDDSLCGHLRVP